MGYIRGKQAFFLKNHRRSRMTKAELIASCHEEIEKLKEILKTAKKASDIALLGAEIREWVLLVAELQGCINRRPQVNVETSKVLKGGIYGNN